MTTTTRNYPNYGWAEWAGTLTMDPSYCNLKVIDVIRILKEVHSKFNYAIDGIL